MTALSMPGNLTTASRPPSFTLYRWSNDSPGTVPTVAFTGNPTPGNSQRYGDTLDVRGAGANTQVILGSRGSTNVVILTTADGINFTARHITVADTLRRQLWAGHCIWRKRHVLGQSHGLCAPPGIV